MSTTLDNILAGNKISNLEDEDLQYFCSVIESRSGISLKPSKQDLIKTRLRSRIAAHGMETFAEYRQLLTTLPANDPEWQVFTNLLTTNKTDFFREPKHFEFLTEKILPQWLEGTEKTFKVWSAASSTGEEAYTLAMILSRSLPANRDFKILATDIDTDVLLVAKNAVYPLSKKSEIPVEYHQSCLDFGRNEVHGWFRIKSHLKEKIVFKQHNLIEKTAPSENTFDLVLCRNVMIYFGQDTIDYVQKKIFGTVKEGGHLFIGHSESLQGIEHRWKSIGPSILKKSSK